MTKKSKVERHARALCAELARVTDGRPMQWRMSQTIGEALGQDEPPADAAIAYAIETGWLIGEGNPPRSICLTDDGRTLSAALLKRVR
jgi:hypothetical protein